MHKNDDNQVPGPGYYLNPDIMAFENYKDVIKGKKSGCFKSEVERQVFPPSKTHQPGPLAYDVQNFNIVKETRPNPKYKKHVPFNTQTGRFVYKPKELPSADTREPSQAKTSSHFY